MTHSEPSLMPSTTIDPYRRLETDDALADQLNRLFDVAEVRQMWLLFLDGASRLADPIMPMDDHPLEPDELFDTEDLGRVPFVRVMVERARMACELVGAHEFVLMWERRGSAALDAHDVRWARGLAEAAGRGSGEGCGQGFGAGLTGRTVAPLRAQLLLHDGGVRVIGEEELA